MHIFYEFLGWIVLWCLRARTRRALARLEDHELADIGMTHQQRDEELAKWFWQGLPPRRGGRTVMPTGVSRTPHRP